MVSLIADEPFHLGTSRVFCTWRSIAFVAGHGTYNHVISSISTDVDERSDDWDTLQHADLHSNQSASGGASLVGNTVPPLIKGPAAEIDVRPIPVDQMNSMNLMTSMTKAISTRRPRAYSRWVLENDSQGVENYISRKTLT